MLGRPTGIAFNPDSWSLYVADTIAHLHWTDDIAVLAATDPDAPGGGFYGPLFATNGPPIRKPLVRPGTDGAIDALWQVAERETGVAIDLGDAPASTSPS